ncbi:MAG: alpha/beta fold hydrolase [Pseudomonadota bacterium]
MLAKTEAHFSSLKKPKNIDASHASKICDDVLILNESFQLKNGGKIQKLRIAYRVIGDVKTQPSLFILGGISASRHIFCASNEQVSGWWQSVFQHWLDSTESLFPYAIISMDFIGGIGDSTSAEELFELENFHCIDTEDQARAVKKLLETLNISTLAGFIGASYGGMIAGKFANLYPKALQKLILINACHRIPVITTAWRCLQRQIITFAKSHNDEKQGLVLARALAMATYRSPEEFEARFAFHDQDGDFPIESYLLHQGHKTCEVFTCESYLCLSESIDRHKFSPEVINVPCAIFSTRNDQIVPQSFIEELTASIGCLAEDYRIHSEFGHDAFLKEIDKVQNFLESYLF